MWREILRIINEATVDGLVQGNYDTNIDKTFLEKLAHSNEVFSAFKVHDMGVDMAKKMRTDEGKLKSFNDWKKDIKGIASHYCGSWLQTEYNTATLRAKFAAEWKQYEADADIMPNLRWMPTTSANPEEEHKVYWMNRLTLPVGDKFWDKHHPGDHWNCKCSLEQTDEPANPDVLSHIPDVKPQKGLAANPGKTGEMFDDSHPYYVHDCSNCWANGNKGLKNIFTNGKKNCNYCSKMKATIKEITNDGYVVKTAYDNGGVLMIHKDVEKNKPDYHTIVDIGRLFASESHNVKVNPTLHSRSDEYRLIFGSLFGTRYENKCPDLTIDGKFYEYEGFEKPWKKKKVSRMLSHGAKQSSRIIINNTKGCSDRYIQNMIKARLDINTAIDEVWIYEKGTKRLTFKDGKFY